MPTYTLHNLGCVGAEGLRIIKANLDMVCDIISEKANELPKPNRKLIYKDIKNMMR